VSQIEVYKPPVLQVQFCLVLNSISIYSIVYDACSNTRFILECNGKKSFITAILEQCVSFGLCKPCDVGLIKGTASAVDQASFLRLLTECINNNSLLEKVGDERELLTRTDELLYSLCSSKGLKQIAKVS